MELERDLVLHYESTIRAIETGRLDLARRRLGAYPIFAESFLKAAADQGVQFSESAASSASMFNWPIPVQIGAYAQKAVEAAIRSQNDDLISDAAYIPVRFLRLSVEHKEFLFYLNMLRMYPRILTLAYDSSLVSIRDRIVEHSWRPLREFCHYWLLSRPKEFDSDLTARYVSLVLWTYADLLKVAMDNGDLDTFGVLGYEFNNLFDNLRIRRSQIEEPTTLSKVINSDRRLIWLGLGAWVVRSRALSGTAIRPGQPDQRLVEQSLIGRFMEVMGANSSTIKDLSETYFQAVTRQYDVTRWERWIWQTLREGVVHTIDYERWLTRYYSLEGLRLVMGGARDEPTPHHQLRFVVEDIESFLREVEQDPQKWADFVPKLRTARLPDDQEMSIGHAIEQFLEANRNAVRKWDQAREDQIISTPLDAAKISSFKEECLSGWRAQNWFEQLLLQHGQITEEAGRPDDEYNFSHVLAPKDMFAGDPDAVSFGLGQGYGSQLADAVNRYLLSELESRCEELQSVEINDVLPAVLGCISLLEHAVVIIFGSLDLESQFLRYRDFIPHWSDTTPTSNVNTYLGRLGHTPVFLQFQEASNKVLIASLSNSGTLVRHVPPKDDYEGLRISITSFEQEEAATLVAEHPEVLPEAFKDLVGKPKDKGEAIRWLLLQVKIFVGAKLEWEGLGSRPGFTMPVSEAGGG